MSVVGTIKDMGIVGFASFALAKLGFVTGWLGWYRQHIVAVPRAHLPKMPGGYVVRELDAAALAHLEIDASTTTQADRFSQGMICLGAFTLKGVLTGVIWLGRSPYREGTIALQFVVPDDGVWDTGMWVHPDHRLSRAFTALWAGVGEWMDAHRLTHSYSMIVDYNGPSLSAHRRLGIIEVGKLLVLQLGSWQWIARGPDRWRLSRRSRPLAWRLPRVASQG